MTKFGFPRRHIVAVLAARARGMVRAAALEPTRFAAMLAAATIVVTATAAGQAAALLYENLEVIYAENFDDVLAMSDLVPQTDVFGAGRLHEMDLGNGPFTPVNLESAPLVPRGAARASVTNTHALGAQAEYKVLGYAPPSPIPGMGDLGLRGTFRNLSITGDPFRVVQAIVAANTPTGNLVAASLLITGSSTALLLSENSGVGGVPHLASWPTTPDVFSAVNSGTPFQVTLLLDRTTGVATGQIVVGSAVVAIGSFAMSIVTPADALPYHAISLGVWNYFDTNVFTTITDTAAVDFDSLEVRGRLPDSDGDGIPDASDVCPSDVANDADGDGVCEIQDNCDTTPNSDQADQDNDGAGDACDPDIDGDGNANAADNCPFDANADQLDGDGDGIGDACDSDLDGDGVLDAVDACVPSPAGEAVNDSGCAVTELCPCAHPQGEDRWKNHGAYVACIAHAAAGFQAAGLISVDEHDAIVAAAGQSSCGMKNTLLSDGH